MKISTFDFNRAKALHYLLEEAHVGRAAGILGITAAAASNALRRLRDDLGDPLLVKRGRGLVRTRLGEELRGPARDVVAAAQVLLRTATPFAPQAFDGELPIALAEHVAAMLLPALDRLARERAPRAILTISAIPLDIADWLKQSGGVMVGLAGPFAATTDGDALVSEDFYLERYVCAMRHGHPLADRTMDETGYAAQDHILVVPRGLTKKSDVDVALDAKGLSRRVARTVPSFNLAIPLVLQSDLVITMPERSAHNFRASDLVIKPMPFDLPAGVMKFILHPAHKEDGRVAFLKALLRDAFDFVSCPS